MTFQIDFSPDGWEQLELLREFDQTRILRVIQQQLTHEPLAATRHKKPMRSNIVAAREFALATSVYIMMLIFRMPSFWCVQSD